jgi:hypothetical protein
MLLGDRAQVLVTLRDDRAYPRLPDLLNKEPVDGAANTRLREQRAALINNLRAARETAHRAFVSSLPGADVVWEESFAAANILLVNANVKGILELLRHDEVEFIEPAAAKVEPPQAISGRALIGTDFWAYVNLPASGYRDRWLTIGLLDTGVLYTHTLLANRISWMLDCVHGTTNNCRNGAGLDPSDHHGHGTATASLISGTANLGNSYMGVSWYTINSYKIYDDARQTLDVPSAIRAIAASEAMGDKVIVAEIALSDSSDSQGLAAAADNAALQYGTTVVAAVGNGQLPGEVDNLPRSPALARNVLGVGAYDVVNGAPIQSFCHGPTRDGRVKPEFIAPSGVYAAGITSDTALGTITFGGTSCATAFAGAQAAIAYNLDFDSPVNEGINLDRPGLAYLNILLNGDRDYNHLFDEVPNVQGVGLSRFPSDWCQNGGNDFGEVTLSGQFQTVDIAMFMPAVLPLSECGQQSINTIEAVIWWSETSAYAHLPINLFLQDVPGHTVAASTSAGSVFQKVRISAAGGWTWHLFLAATRLPDHPVKIYWYLRGSVR